VIYRASWKTFSFFTLLQDFLKFRTQKKHMTLLDKEDVKDLIISACENLEVHPWEKRWKYVQRLQEMLKLNNSEIESLTLQNEIVALTHKLFHSMDISMQVKRCINLGMRHGMTPFSRNWDIITELTNTYILSKDKPVDIPRLCRLLKCLLNQCNYTVLDLEWHKEDITSFEWCLNDELKKISSNNH